MKTKTQIRRYLVLFILLLALSGITAFPLRTEMNLLIQHLSLVPAFMRDWVIEIHQAISQTPDLVLYGTDWLAFAHLVIALFFIPVYIDPVRYKANLVVAMIACIAVFFLAFICGPIRGIPFFHQLIDCSFGFLGFWPLFIVYRKITELETINPNHI